MTLANTEPKWPSLPAGYFFRVKRSPLGHYPYVEIRKSMWVGSCQVAAGWQNETKFRTLIHEVEWLANATKQRWQDKDRWTNSGEYWTGDSK